MSHIKGIKLSSSPLLKPHRSKRHSNLLSPLARLQKAPFAQTLSLEPLSEEQQRVICAAENLAHTCGYEAIHTQTVTRLALRLFDELYPLHQLDGDGRFYLECACILHDIGWVEGWKNHHKTSLRIILRNSLLPLEHRERLIVGSIARYHTKALPSLEHDHFAALGPQNREIVVILSSLLRLADAMDYTHRCLIEDLSCRISPRWVRVNYLAQKRSREDEEAACVGANLLQKVFHRKFRIKWIPD